VNGDDATRLHEIAAVTRRGVARLAQRLRVERSPSALSGNKVLVLAHLHRNGASSPGEIAAAEHQRPQSLTRVFAELEADNLVVRRPGQRDRRESRLELTDAGRNALRGDMAERDRWLASVLAELTETEAELLRLAGALLDRLADAAPATRHRARPAA